MARHPAIRTQLRISGPDKMKVILVLVVLAEMFAPNKPAYAQNAPIAGHSDNGALVFKKCMPCHQVGLDA